MATMMPVEIDKFCANCVMHNWKQPDDIQSLINCPGCRLIKYCGEACRKEHWRKVHRNHCQFLAHPTKCPQSEHDDESCANCRPATGTGAIGRPTTGTGKGKRRMSERDKKKNPASYSYECFIKDIHFPPGLLSPHPFPLAGVEDDLLEKSVIVMQKLVHKLTQNPRVAMVCSAELEEMEMVLWSKRRDIWGYRKVLSQRQIVYLTLDFGQFLDLVKSLTAKVSYGKAGKDATELWKTIYLVLVVITGGITTYRQLEVLKNPIDNIPEQFRDIVKMALDNKYEFHNIVEEIIDSLSTRVIPYEDTVKKLCGGKKRQKCSFCGVKIEVTEYIYIEEYEYDKKYCDRRCSSVLFDALSIRIFTCGSQDCHTKVSSLQDDMQKLSLTVLTACNERNGVRCDYCFQLCPIDQAHRCCNCLTVMYCSKSCHKEDKEKHSRKYCIEDERKTKGDRSMRRQMGEITPAKMAAMAAGSVIENRKDMLNEALEAFHFEDSKKEDGDPVTEREQDTSIPEAATVPAGEDNRSKSATGAAPNAEHVNNRSTTGAGATATERAQGKSASGAEAAGENSISEVD